MRRKLDQCGVGMKDLGVLVVDDDSAILSVIERMFGHFKVKVDCARSSAEALGRLPTRSYRIMITNLDMSKMDRLELARIARKLFPALNIILFTGSTPEHVLDLALNAKVSEISGMHRKSCSLGDMVMAIVTKETGRTFLLE